MSDYMAEQIGEATKKFEEQNATLGRARAPVLRRLFLMGVTFLVIGAALTRFVPVPSFLQTFLEPELWTMATATIALLALGMGWITLVNSTSMAAHPAKTMGIVESARHIRKAGQEGHYLTCKVKYEVAGQAYNCKWQRGALSSADNYVGTSVAVHYDPNNPSASVVGLSLLGPVLGTFFYSAFMIATGVLLYLRFPLF